MNYRNFISKIFLVCLAAFNFSSAEAAFKFPAPIPTTEFDKMAFPQVYPTYSWEAVPNTEFYQIQIFKDGKLLRELKNSEAFYKMTDTQPITEVGKYFWQVRVVDKNNQPLSDWSEKNFFEVTAPVKFAVLGDSISHGGASFIPAGQLSCQWETFCKIPVKNISRSGDKTSQMIERFDSEVLPFRPKFLIIIGGVNDIRIGSKSDEVIKNLQTLQKKCAENNITPIFGTLTPMNEKILRGRGIFLTDDNWRDEFQKVNSWILKNKFAVDISKKLFDAENNLRADMTIDGLHPDVRGKKIIGEEIEKFLIENFSAETEE